MRKGTFLLTIFAVLGIVSCGGGGGGGGSTPTYSLSGTVSLNGVGYEGVTVTLGGDDSDAAITDSTGSFSFEVPDGDYTLTPTLAGQEFTPAARPVSVAGADSADNDFAFVTHSIYGTVTMNSTGRSNVTVTASASGMASYASTTGVDGAYAISGLLNADWTVAPALSGQTFTPTSMIAVVDGASVSNQDFAVDTWDISGQVTLNGGAAAGVGVLLTGDADLLTSTDSSGNYTFAGLMNGSYSVAASSTNQSFTPVNYAAAVSGSDLADRDFAFLTYALSGQVTFNGTGYQGATVDLGGDRTLSTSTDSSGAYSFAGLLNGSYTVTPSVSGQTLSPANRAVSVSYADTDLSGFALVTYTISGQVTHGGTGKGGVAISLSGMSADAATTNGSGSYSFTGLLKGSYTVTPVLYDQTFAPASSTFSVSSASVGDVDFDIPEMIWFVDADSPAGTPDGLSWGTAFMNPQNGSDMAASGDQVWVADGTYASMDTGDRAMPVLAMKDHVRYYGGFTGTETDRTQRDWEANPTILTGDIGTEGDISDNSYHVVLGADGALLDGFTVTRGNAHISSYNHPDNKGGGMSNVGVSPTVVNCVFLENSAYQNGGGMHNQNSTPFISRCSFIGNFNIPKSGTADSGGGMSNENASPVVRDCLFEGNSAYNGGGMHNQEVSSGLVVDGCVFVDNAGYDGGGMYNSGMWFSPSTPKVTNCVFLGNSATRGGGGMMNNYYASPTVANCTFTGNSAGEGGNAVRNWYWSSPQIANCILWDVGEEVGSDSESHPSVTYCDVKGGYAGTGNIDVDPEFYGPAEDDYRLRDTSPCLDVGTNSAVTTSFDLAGAARIQNDVVDMGAYEGGFTYVPKVVYVDIDSVAGEPDGLSWETAFTHPQDAVDVAYAGDQVWVAEGSYAPLSTADRNVPLLAMKSGVEVYGGFAGNEMILSERNLSSHETTLDGLLALNHVVVGASNARLDGFSIIRGRGIGTSGGGMLNTSCTNLDIAYCRFQANQVEYVSGRVQGGGIYNDGGAPTIRFCVFQDNVALGGANQAEGGGVANNNSSTAIIANSWFLDNAGGGGGGGISNFNSSTPLIANCLLTGNSAVNGAAINNSYGAPATIINCTLYGNNAADTGGGIYSHASSPIVHNCIVWGNSSAQIANVVSGGAVITYSDIQGGYSGTGNIDNLPSFVDTGNYDLHLQSGSPCIDTGTNVPISGYLATLPDLDGNSRIKDGNGDFTHLIDMGAYEYQP